MGVLVEASATSDAQVYPAGDVIPSLLYRPTQLARLLNSTPLGEVVCERRLLRDRVRSGGRICHERRVDLWRYVAWLIGRRREKKSRTKGTFSSDRADGRVTAKSVMQLLESQEFRCALTGRELTPKTVSLDHILPVSKGGKHCIKNAQVLHKDVNRAKGTLTNAEFVQLCREVVAHADRASERERQQGEVA